MPPHSPCRFRRSTACLGARAASLALGIMSAQGALAQAAIEWASPVDGDFGDAANWLPAVVPGAVDTAVLGRMGPYRVTLDNSVTLGAVMLPNPEVSLLVSPRTSLTLGGLSGTGEIIVRGGALLDHATLFAQSGATMNGRVRLAGEDPLDSRIARLSGSVPAFGPDAVITGTNGTIMGTWTSEGLITIDEPGTISLRGANFTGGTLRSRGGGQLDLTSAVLNDLTIDAGPESLYRTNSSTVLSGVTISGVYTLDPGNNIRLGPGVVIEDEIVVHNGTSPSDATLFVQSGATLNGRVRLSGENRAAARISRLSGSRPAFGPDAVITGTYGTISGTWRSEGLITINEPGKLVLSDTHFTGGTLRSRGGGELDLTGATLSGVTIDAGPDSLYRTDISTFVLDSTIVGPLRIEPGEDILIGRNVVIQDEIIVNNGTSASDAVLFVPGGVAITGRVRLNGRSEFDAGIGPIGGSGNSFGPDAVLCGKNGGISGTWATEGTITPGDASTPVGLLLLRAADIDLLPPARLEFDIAGVDPEQHDRIDGSGTVTLDGSLTVNFVDGYIPDPKDQFEIISVTSVEGSFADVDIEPVGAIGPAHVVYTGDSVIVVICAADRDADGELTIFDFLEFQNLFDAGDLRADLDEDGQLTIFDFLVFQNRFDAGCG